MYLQKKEHETKPGNTSKKEDSLEVILEFEMSNLVYPYGGGGLNATRKRTDESGRLQESGEISSKEWSRPDWSPHLLSVTSSSDYLVNINKPNTTCNTGYYLL